MSECEIYYAEIQQALSKGNAAVMVGAGFSRNAEGGSRLPTWENLAQAIAQKLDPNSNPKTFSTANVTQLAEQYAQVFSYAALENLLKKMIPDERVAPTRLYDELLSLPWSEIFTTNYDTLLERAADKNLDKAHFTITCREDIPHSKVLNRRRIIKLHGSFPSQRPFIFTEEDYRTYPKKFAPFVNLVRQSLLENVFCLIGFSGDDPNFLHWLGWVRDMLDTHALPVYLFLTEEPPIGLKKLLQARGVTPVLLPSLVSGDKKDYAGRYSELFRRLAKTDECKTADWGVIGWPAAARAYQNDADDQYVSFLKYSQSFSIIRLSYPGWIVAPKKNRNQLKSSIRQLPSAVEEKTIQERIRKDAPVIAVVILSNYAWLQDVLLAPLLDSVAETAVNILRENKQISFSAATPQEKERLIPYQIDSDWRMDQCLSFLIIAIIRWARQRLDLPLFAELEQLLIERFPADGQIRDAVCYENILFNLYRGERGSAWTLLQAWRIESTDQIFSIRKAMLSAELGAPDNALQICATAIKVLRENQKIRPDDALLLSQEAWACYLAERLRQGLDFIVSFGPEGKYSVPETPSFDDRLESLARHGYDVDREISDIISALQAEAQPPFSAKYKLSGFDLGTSSVTERFGLTGELQSKIDSAFAWLELADRLCLPIRTTRVNYFSNQFIQAAWWAQYGDSFARIFSILVRSMQPDSLKPKDESLSPHRTGWLSRYQVARMDEDIAIDFSKRLLNQLKDFLTGDASLFVIEVNVEFYLEVYSRLVIRIRDREIILKCGQDLLNLHYTTAVHNRPELWKPLSIAVARTLESSPADIKLLLLRAFAELPFRPNLTPDNHYYRDWLAISSFETNKIPANELPSWRPVVESALRELKRSNNDSSLWIRIFWLTELNAMSAADLQEVGAALWFVSDEWPIIPGFRPTAAFKWPTHDEQKRDDAFLRLLFSSKLNRLSKPIDDGRRSWTSSVDNEYIHLWRMAFSRLILRSEHLDALLDELDQWWSEEGDAIIKRIATENVHGAIVDRLDSVDAILAEVVALTSKFREENSNELIERVFKLRERISTSSIRLFRLDVICAAIGNDTDSSLNDKFINGLLSGDENEIAAAYRSAKWLVSNFESFPQLNFDVLLDISISAAYGRRLPGLTWAITLLADYFFSFKELSMKKYIEGADRALGMLLLDLSYARPGRSGIIDDAVPLLRFQCARLAHALSGIKAIEAPNAEKWLLAACDDPLPEMRFKNFAASL